MDDQAVHDAGWHLPISLDDDTCRVCGESPAEWAHQIGQIWHECYMTESADICASYPQDN